MMPAMARATGRCMMESEMRMSRITPIAVAVLFGAGSAALAQGYRGDDAKEVRALDRVQVSLIDAIMAAESETGGRALDAQLEVENREIFYQVEVFDGRRIKEVYVDSQDGSILDVVKDWD
jgi:uncharacterized membrane protein YkoI